MLTRGQEQEVHALVKTLDRVLTAMERSPIPANSEDARERDAQMSGVRRDLFAARQLLPHEVYRVLSDNSAK